MDNNNYEIRLLSKRIEEIPLNDYELDFTFVVNNEEFQTTRIIADLLSPIICKAHKTDPTLNTYTITTKHKGDFQKIIKLSNFDTYIVPDSEVQFIYEIMRILGNNSLKFRDKVFNLPITNETVLDRILHIYDNISNYTIHNINEEVGYLSSHFSELYLEQETKLLKIPIDILEIVFKNDQLQVESEDQLLQFITKLYMIDSNNSNLFQYVDFLYISPESISDFISIFNINDITQEAWNKLSVRLVQNIKGSKYNSRQSLNQRRIEIPYEKDGEFKGIFNYLLNDNDNDEQKVVVTSSTRIDDPDLAPQNVLVFDDHDKYFFSDDEPSPWICFEFINHKIIPTNYTIQKTEDYYYPRNWIIEGSDDNANWVTLDEQQDSSFLDDDPYYTYTIDVQNETGFRFVRMRTTGANSSTISDSLIIDSFEFYGYIVD